MHQAFSVAPLILLQTDVYAASASVQHAVALAQFSEAARSAPAPPPRVVIKRAPVPMTINACPSFRNAQVRNFSCSDAGDLVNKLKEAQIKLKNGEALYFDLFSGAPASNAMTKVPPREAFIKLPFAKAFIIERVRTDNRLWQPYKLAYKPAGPGEAVWDIEVALGFHGQLLRVEMRYGPPPPV